MPDVGGTYILPRLKQPGLGTYNNDTTTTKQKTVKYKFVM